MRYLLVVGFSCDVYRKEPRARIFVGNKLIDEFYISHSPDNINKAKTHYYSKINPKSLQPIALSENLNLYIKNFPILRFYEVELDEKIKHLTLCINIDNNSNNYVNGYMTKSTLIKFKICYFFPFNKTLLLRLKEIRNKNRNSINYAWYRTDKNFLFNIIDNGMYWKGSNGQKFYTQPGYTLQDCNVGGNGDFICQLTKKYGIYVQTLARSCRYSFDWDMTSFFFDKYQQYENQRNTD